MKLQASAWLCGLKWGHTNLVHTRFFLCFWIFVIFVILHDANQPSEWNLMKFSYSVELDQLYKKNWKESPNVILWFDYYHDSKPSDWNLWFTDPTQHRGYHVAHVWYKIGIFRGEQIGLNDSNWCNQMPSTNQNAWFTLYVRIVK